MKKFELKYSYPKILRENFQICSIEVVLVAPDACSYRSLANIVAFRPE